MQVDNSIIILIGKKTPKILVRDSKRKPDKSINKKSPNPLGD